MLVCSECKIIKNDYDEITFFASCVCDDSKDSIAIHIVTITECFQYAIATHILTDHFNIAAMYYNDNRYKTVAIFYQGKEVKLIEGGE